MASSQQPAARQAPPAGRRLERPTTPCSPLPMQVPGKGKLLVHARSRHSVEVEVAAGQQLRWELAVLAGSRGGGGSGIGFEVTLCLDAEDGTLQEQRRVSGTDGRGGGGNVREGKVPWLRPADGVVSGCWCNSLEASVGTLAGSEGTARHGARVRCVLSVAHVRGRCDSDSLISHGLLSIN
jgi:hypothetical protein